MKNVIVNIDFGVRYILKKKRLDAIYLEQHPGCSALDHAHLYPTAHSHSDVG